jgi:ATP-dependent RNA helicase DeaD
VEEGYVRLVMDAGYDIGVRPKDIVGAIANEANVPGRAVGNIDIRDRFTYIEVQEEYVDRILSRVPSTRLRGRNVTFRKV